MTAYIIKLLNFMMNPEITRETEAEISLKANGR